MRSFARVRSAPAYTLVDLSGLPSDIRKEIIDDASQGGSNYGVRVVEEAVAGAIRSPIFGVYGHDKEKWEEAKNGFGIASTEVADDTVQGGLDTDPRTEAALREQAAESANVAADRLRMAEDRDISAITGDAEPNVNITDATLAADATNRADRPESTASAKPTKTPR